MSQKYISAPDLYIHEYSTLTPQEYKVLAVKRRFKKEFPAWEETMVLLTELVRKHLPASSKEKLKADRPRVLDVGCGKGNYVLDELAEQLGKTTGIDLDEESTRGNTSVDELDYFSGQKLPYSDASFNVVTSLWVIEHLDDPETFFREIYRVLQRGGICACVTPNENSYLIMLRKLFNQTLTNFLVTWLYGRTEKDIFPVRYKANTVEAVRKLAKEIGFKEKEVVLNFDPGYTSFTSFLYWLNTLLYKTNLPLFKPHLLIVLEK